jgi:hypothetical protein
MQKGEEELIFSWGPKKSELVLEKNMDYVVEI